MLKVIINEFAAIFLAAIMMLSGTGVHIPSDLFSPERSTRSSVSAEMSPEDALIEQALKYDGYTQKQMIRERGKDYRCAWCCYFVTDMARLTDLSYAIPYEGSCSSLFTTLTQEMGAKVVSTPQKGDLVFFRSSKEKVKPYIHIAIVAESNEDNIKVIHGNYNNKVAVRNDTEFNDGKGNSTADGTVSCLYVRPAYRKQK